MRRLLLFILLCYCADGHAANFTVNTTADTNDGVCNAQCSLREAVAAANSAPGADSISFAAAAFGTAKTIVLKKELALADEVSITGPAAGVTVQGDGGSFIPFYVLTTASLNRLSIVNNVIGIRNEGKLTVSSSTLNSQTGCISSLGSSAMVSDSSLNSAEFGIYVEAQTTATLTGCKLNGNNVGIDNGGEVTATGCTFTNSDLAGIRTTGGNCRVVNSTFSNNNRGIYALDNGTATTAATAISCTLNDNTADFDIFGSYFVAINCTMSNGASFLDGGGSANLSNCTASNSTLYGLDGQLILNNTLSVNSDPRQAGVLGDFVGNGRNILTGTPAAAGLEVDANGKGLLKDNGGPTKTIALVTRGTAVNSGDNYVLPIGLAEDQRGPGFARIKGGNVDVGAYESEFVGSALTVGDVLPVNEGSAAAPGAATFTVTLSAAAAKTVTVHYATADPATGAVAGQDYIATGGTLTFSPGQTVKKVTVKFIGDNVAETNEAFFLNLSAPSGATIGDGQAVVYIKNDDGPSISIANAPTVKEGNSGTTPQLFTVSLSAASAQTVSVKWATANNTAGPADFVATSGTLTFAPGQTSKVIVVQVKGDTTVEPTESYRVKLSSPVNALPGNSQASGFITNDDVAALLSDDEPSE